MSAAAHRFLTAIRLRAKQLAAHETHGGERGGKVALLELRATELRRAMNEVRVVFRKRDECSRKHRPLNVERGARHANIRRPSEDHVCVSENVCRARRRLLFEETIDVLAVKQRCDADRHAEIAANRLHFVERRVFERFGRRHERQRVVEDGEWPQKLERTLMYRLKDRRTFVACRRFWSRARAAHRFKRLDVRPLLSAARDRVQLSNARLERRARRRRALLVYFHGVVKLDLLKVARRVRLVGLARVVARERLEESRRFRSCKSKGKNPLGKCAQAAQAVRCDARRRCRLNVESRQTTI